MAKSIVLTLQTLSASLQLAMDDIEFPDVIMEEQGENPLTLVLSIGVFSIDEAYLSKDQTFAYLIGEPVRISIEARQGDAKHMLSKWKAYGIVSLPLPMSSGAGPAPTIVRIDEGGTLQPLPTKSAGQQMAQARSGMEGVFALIRSMPTFQDVEGRWSETDITDMASRLILRGVSAEVFEPQRTITRAELTMLLVRALGLQAASDELQRFNDVQEGAWYTGAIAAAVQAGLVTGDTGGSFRPDAALTREEAAVIMGRALAYTGMETALTDLQVSRELSSWNDAGQISGWAREGMAILHKRDILRGDIDGDVRPQAKLTREETAALLRRVLRTAGWID